MVQVQFPAAALSVNNLRQVVHTDLPLLPSSITCTSESWCIQHSTSSQYSLFIRRYSCSVTFIILSKNNCYASPCLWNQLPLSLHPTHFGTSFSISYSPISSPMTSSSSDPPLCTSITPSLFHSWLKTYLFHKSYPPPVV